VVEGKVCDLKTLKAIAALPPKEELVAKALGSLKVSDSGSVNVLNATSEDWSLLSTQLRRRRRKVLIVA